MSERFNHTVKLRLTTLLRVVFTLMAQAVLACAQTSENRSADGLSLQPTDQPCLDALASAGTSPALLGLADVAARGTAAAGGLWLSGNTAGGLTHLHWIAGNQPAGLLKVDGEGKVTFDLMVLASAAGGSSGTIADQRARVASFVRSDEGLRLLAELTEGPYRILLYVGPLAPTRAGGIGHYGLLNLDNRFDSRINPLRPKGQKLDRECPPEGFDSMVAIDTDVCWFNLENWRLMPLAQMTFHELAEAHARLALGLDYLSQGDKPGAHDVALDREIRLKQKRPAQFVVMPIGMNLRLATREDWLRLFAKLATGRTKARGHAELR